MKCCTLRLGLARRLLALSVSLATVLAAHGFVLASFAKSGNGSGTSRYVQLNSQKPELKVISASATATPAGILLRWRTNSVADNVGFNIYRLKDQQRTRLNREIVPGAVFAPTMFGEARGGNSYSWLDRSGTADATYFIESLSVDGATKIHQPIIVAKNKSGREFDQTPDARSAVTASATDANDTFEKYYPAQTAAETGTLSGTIQQQWEIAAQPSLKIAIRKDGWYRVTQQQMVAAGFNPAVDTKNLRLFVEANEVAISTNQSSGQFGVGDYIEFYGQGLDRPTTDSQIYYLIAGTTPGKRVRGDNQVDLLPDTPAMPPASSGQPAPPAGNAILRDPIFFSWVEYSLSVLRESLRIRNESEAGQRGARDDAATGITPNSNQETDSNLSENAVAPEVVPIAYGGKNPEQTAGADGRKKNVETATLSSAASIPIRSTPKTNNRDVIATLVAKPANAPTRQRRLRTNSGSRKRKVKKPRHQPQRHERNHALLGGGFVPSNFTYTALRKDRSVYFVTVLNGDEENFFGQVITFNSSNPASQTINSPNPDLTSSVPARLEIALQGVNVVLHQVNIEFNGVVIGTFSFFGFDPAGGGHPVQVFNIPASQLHDGANTIRFILPAGGDVSIVDYVKLSYQHLFRVDTAAPCSTANRVADESLRFSIAGTQSVKVDGFCIPQVRLIDYTDPLDVIVTKPDAEPSASGYAITAPLSSPISKAPRLLYALRQDQFAQPAAISLNQPSTLNQGMLSQTATAGADFLVISNKSFIPNLTPLSNQRQAQGFTAAVVDVEDIYDEFGYGVHGPVAIKDFLSYAAAHWAVPPRYVILAGDGSFDPRNYFGLGNFDFVPTKLVDATFNETCSDDWLTDFDNDGIANIPVGRLPVRSAAEADLVVSKIVNFSPATVPQTALLVADDPTGYYFNFETANDQVQALLPADMTVQRVNVRTEGAAQAKTDIISGFNQGRALVNYTGHGNVDVWTGAAIFTSADATALTNGNTKLSFVVVMDCLNGYFQDPILLSLSEALVKAPGGGAVATFASSGLTLPDGQHAMGQQLISLLYGSTPIALGDAIKIAKGATSDIDVRRTWIYFGDPSIKIR